MSSLMSDLSNLSWAFWARLGRRERVF